MGDPTRLPPDAAPPARGVFVFDPDVLDRLAAVEGAPWAEGQRTGAGLGGPPAEVAHTIAAFQAAWTTLQAELAGTGETWGGTLDPGDFGGPRGGTIYGEGGYARYVVRGDGEVVLLGNSTRPEKVTLARAAGFRVVR